MEGDQGRQREAALCDRHEDGSGFGLAGLWESWKDPSTNEWTRTFAVLTTEANELVADIHDRMPVILRPEDHDRWLGSEPDPRDLLRPFPAELMRMWPISTRVNSPKNDDADLLIFTPVPPDSIDKPGAGAELCLTARVTLCVVGRCQPSL